MRTLYILAKTRKEAIEKCPFTPAGVMLVGGDLDERGKYKKGYLLFESWEDFRITKAQK